MPLANPSVTHVIAGNTAGVTANISTGTYTLAGGDNITLSQAGNVVTISGAAGGAGGSNTLGMSNLGNSAGTSGVVSGSAIRYLFAGGDNITLSQSINGVSATLTISGGAGAAAGSDTHGVSNLGNTAGTSGVVSGSNLLFVLAGGNNITLSQSINGSSATVTVSAFNQTAPVVSNALQDVGTATGSGTNTSRFAADDHVHRGQAGWDVNGIASTFYGTQQLSAGALLSLATGGNTTRGSIQFINLLSSATTASRVESANVVGAMASRFALEGHQHAGLYQISVGGNTVGTTSAGAGSIHLAGGPNVTLSGSTAAGGMTLSVSAPAAGAGTYTFSGGMSTGGNTAGNTGYATDRLNLAGGNNITLSGSTNAGSMTITISAAAGGAAPTLSYFNNLNPAIISSFNTSHGTFFVVPLSPFGPFPGNMTVSTMMMNLSMNFTATSNSSSHTYSFDVGLYTLNGSTLSLLNSARSTWGYAAATANTSNYHGARWLTLNSSLFSTDLTLSQTHYWMGIMMRSSNYAVPMSWMGYRAYHTSTRSGTIGVSSNATTLKWNYFLGRMNASTASPPATLEASQLRGEDAATYPMVVFQNLNSIW